MLPNLFDFKVKEAANMLLWACNHNINCVNYLTKWHLDRCSYELPMSDFQPNLGNEVIHLEVYTTFFSTFLEHTLGLSLWPVIIISNSCVRILHMAHLIAQGHYVITTYLLLQLFLLSWSCKAVKTNFSASHCKFMGEYPLRSKT